MQWSHGQNWLVQPVNGIAQALRTGFTSSASLHVEGTLGTLVVLYLPSGPLYTMFTVTYSAVAALIVETLLLPLLMHDYGRMYV